MMKIHSFLGTLALFPMMVLANGSVSREDIEPVLKSNPALEKALTGAFVLDEVGSGVRLGRMVGNLGGARTGPYEFGATVLNGGGKVSVTLHTAVRFIDASGKTVFLENIKPESQGLSISEKFVRYEVATNQEAAPAPVAGTDGGLQWEEFDLIFGPGESGNARRGMLNGVLRELEVNYDEGEHIGWTFQVVYDENKLPSKVISSSSSYRRNSANENVDEIKTRVLEYKDGSLVKISASDKTNADGIPVDFESLRITSMAAKRVYLTAAQMRTDDRRVLANLVQDAIDAQTRLTEPMVTASDSRWKPVDLKGKVMEVDFAFTTSAAALYFVRELKLLPSAQAAEQPAYLWTDLLSLKDGVTTVLITARGYKDDMIEGERFLVSIVQVEGGWRLQGVGRQTKKWQGVDWE